MVFMGGGGGCLDGGVGIGNGVYGRVLVMVFKEGVDSVYNSV